MKILFTIIGVGLIACVQCAHENENKKGVQISPEVLVSNLYEQKEEGPFFQTESREMVEKYFTARLANLIWKDAISTPRGEIGALDFDPLYDAQDLDITNFSLNEIQNNNGSALVIALFENMGHKTEITYLLVQTRVGWRIDDIRYRDGKTLSSILSVK